MGIGRAVEEFVALGPLPDANADEGQLAIHQIHLQRIKRPITDEEATLLIGSFGPDECYGLAWALLHLIESAPGGAPLASKPSESENEWIRLLWDRSHR